MATAMESSINVSALKLSDPYVKTIVDTAAHVALYSFNSESYEWEKVNVEGALFLCGRTGEPKNNLMILNRLNTFSFIEPITEGLDLQLHDPFLLYRNTQGQINGIWFYDKDECVRIAESIGKLVRDCTISKMNNGNSFDAYNLLSKPPDPVPAKADWEKLSSDGTSKRVMDFFAKASSSAPVVQPGGFIAPPPGLPGQKNEVKPLLQRLMSSNPVHTVEQIEKQQRTVTPHKESSGIVKKRIVIKESHNKQQQLNAKSRPISLTLNSTSPLCVSPQTKIENDLCFLSISSEATVSASPNNSSQDFFGTKFSNFSEEPLEVSELEKCVSGSVTGLDSPLKPALIPPVMFASSAKKEEPVPSSGQQLSLSVRPEPLTKSQLLQAVTYLLKNDSDFINKLHEAYVKSFVDMVS